MKKIVGAAILFCFTGLGACFAQDASKEEWQDVPPSVPEGELVNLNTSRALVQIDELIRRVSDLERGKRSQDERIRNVERTVDDLKRRL